MRTLDLAMSYGEGSQIIFFRVAPATDSDSQSDRYSMWRPDNVGLFATIGFVDPLRNYSGWWLTYPSEKYENQWEGWHPIYEMEHKKIFETTNQYLFHSPKCLNISLKGTKKHDLEHGFWHEGKHQRARFCARRKNTQNNVCPKYKEICFWLLQLFGRTHYIYIYI